MYRLYSFLYFLGFLIYLPKELLKRKDNKPLNWLKEKLGYITPPTFQDKKPIIWIHAVSVGEVLVIAPLIKNLAEQYNIILTTITDTGRLVAQNRFSNLPVRIYYLPLDLERPLLKFFHKTQPQVLLIAETEIWPNLIRIISEKIPVALINGRISERSFKRYKFFKFFFKPLFNKLKFLAVQEEIYAQRLIKIGVNPEKIKVVGNLKFELIIPERDFPELKNLPRPLIIAGSTHFPEEEIILKSFLKALDKGSLILVPRHPERFKEVEHLIMKNIDKDIEFLKYSELKTSLKNFKKAKAVLLFDEMGILSSLYKICDLAIIGGSFIPHGGQNPLEAIYWKKPVITGPYMNNFPFVRDFVKEKALIQVYSEKLSETLKNLIENPKIAQEIAERAYQLFQNKKGALEKTLKLIESIIS
ncbi:MAG: glycosyltransferase N-terminal domain-containing protein [Caldimicrobium sp.]